jgi:hypothetical protein
MKASNKNCSSACSIDDNEVDQESSIPHVLQNPNQELRISLLNFDKSKRYSMQCASREEDDIYK